jgi:hypothetical protein
LLAGPRQRLECLPDLAQVRHHRNEDAHLAERAGAQDGAKLLPEHAGLRQAPADGTQAQRRIQHMLVPQLGHAQSIQRLVGTDVDRADRHRQPFIATTALR